MQYFCMSLLFSFLFASCLATATPWVPSDDSVYIKYTLFSDEDPKLYIIQLSAEGDGSTGKDNIKPVRSGVQLTPSYKIFSRLVIVHGPDDVRCRFRKRDRLRWMSKQRVAKYRSEILTRTTAVDGPISDVGAIVCTSALEPDEDESS